MFLFVVFRGEIQCKRGFASLVRLSWIAVLAAVVVLVFSARCLRLDYSEASAKHSSSRRAERQSSFHITGSETQKWISSSEMKTENTTRPKVSSTVCLYQRSFSFAHCVKLLILPHKHRKLKKDGYRQKCELKLCSCLLQPFSGL